MTRWIILLVSLILFLSNNVAFASNTYDLGKLEYFPPEKKQQKNHVFSMSWRNAQATPEPLVQLLEQPNEQNAKAYVHWQKIRQQRIRRVQQLIKKASHEANQK